MKTALFFSLVFFLYGCYSKNDSESQEVSTTIEEAKNFYITKSPDSTSNIVVNKPWVGARQVKKYKISKPLKKLVCTSTTHLPYFELLGSIEVLKGFPNTQYISSSIFTERVERGLVKDIGNENNLNFELILDINPDAIIIFDNGLNTGSIQKLEELGIDVIYNSDYLEETPLGRAEWIKFFGVLLGKEKMADSIFNAIKHHYLALKLLTEQVTEKPTVMSGIVYNDSWHTPGGHNWSALFFEHAGADYVWNQDTTSGWLTLSFEAMYQKAQNTDFWVGTSTVNSLKELQELDSRNSYFSAFSDGNVFNYSKKRGKKGGYDYFESAYARPDLVLNDLISIFHPSLISAQYETTYFQKLN